jgi:hypothetical protein
MRYAGCPISRALCEKWGFSLILYSDWSSFAASSSTTNGCPAFVIFEAPGGDVVHELILTTQSVAGDGQLPRRVQSGQSALNFFVDF